MPMWALILLVVLLILVLVYVVLPALGASTTSVAVPFWLATRNRKGTR